MPISRRSIVEASEVKELFDYDPETGWLYWKGELREGRPLLATYCRGNLTQGRVQFFTGYVSSGRLVWAWHHGRWPRGNLKRRNYDTRDDRIDNLVEGVDMSEMRALERKEGLSAADVKRLFDYDPDTGQLLNHWAKDGDPDRVATMSYPSQRASTVKIGRKVFQAAKVVWCWHNRKWPKGHLHRKDGDGHNDRIDNLTEKKPDLSYNPNRPEDAHKIPVQFMDKGKLVWLGAFDTQEQADAALDHYWGRDMC